MVKLWPISLVVTLVGAMTVALVARPDIYPWEYVDPGSPALGKQPSATITSGGAGTQFAGVAVA